MIGSRLLLSFVAFSVVAAGSGDEIAPRVYTNADLVALPEAALTETAPPSEPEDWPSVTEFLEREYARLATQQALDLERARLDAETRYAETREVYTLPFYPYVGYQTGWNTCAGPEGRRHVNPTAAYGAHGIRPLHAGPTRAEILRTRARPAFPSHGRGRPGR